MTHDLDDLPADAERFLSGETIFENPYRVRDWVRFKALLLRWNASGKKIKMRVLSGTIAQVQAVNGESFFPILTLHLIGTAHRHKTVILEDEEIAVYLEAYEPDGFDRAWLAGDYLTTRAIYEAHREYHQPVLPGLEGVE